MFKSYSIASIVAASLALTPITAQAGDAFVGGLVGGIIGGAIANSANNQRPKRTYTTTSRVTVSSATRQANRETQTALNYFGFNAGTPDGVLGSRSRAAISQYQALLNYPITGQLTQYERDFLMSSYYRAQSGGPATSQMIATNPQGVRGLLVIYRDEQMGGSTTTTASVGGAYGLPREVAAVVNEIARSSDPTAEQLVQRHGFIQLADLNSDGQTDYIIDTSVTGSAFWCNAESCAVRVFASTPNGYERNDFQAFNVTPAMFSCQRGSCSKSDGTGSVPTMAANPAPSVPQITAAAPVPSAVPSVKPSTTVAAAPAVPNFFGGGDGTPSLESHCNKVSLLTSTNGGFVTADTMTDPAVAMSEQMCLARTYTIAAGEDLMQKVPNLSPSQIAEQCAAFGQTLQAHVSDVSLKPREAVMQGIGSFVVSSGMSPQQLEMTAKICLSAGYKADDMDTAIGSTLLLIALGQAPYAELVGHHLAQGYGATKRPDLAADWYDHALTALEGGATPVVSPGQPERVAVLRKASSMLGGNSAAANGSAIPVFTLGKN